MIFKKNDWDGQINIELQHSNVLIINNSELFFQYQKELCNQNNGEIGTFTIFGVDKLLNFETEVEVIPNIFTISINTRKTLTYLHKKIVKEFALSDQILSMEKIKMEFIDLLTKLRRDTLINFSFVEDVEFENFIKIFDIKFSDQIMTPSELIIKYIDLLVEITKVKVIIISFAIYLLTCEEIMYLYEYCCHQNLNIIFLEKDKPRYLLNENFKITYVDNEILINK